MITKQEWKNLGLLLETILDTKLKGLEDRLEQKLEQKLELKLEQKLEQKLNLKFDEKLGEFAIIMKNAFDEVHYKIDTTLARLDSHDRRIYTNEQDIKNIKKVVRI